jgi:hypothetical protein
MRYLGERPLTDDGSRALMTMVYIYEGPEGGTGTTVLLKRARACSYICVSVL